MHAICTNMFSSLMNFCLVTSKFSNTPKSYLWQVPLQTSTNVEYQKNHWDEYLLMSAIFQTVCLHIKHILHLKLQCDQELTIASNDSFLHTKSIIYHVVQTITILILRFCNLSKNDML